MVLLSLGRRMGISLVGVGFAFVQTYYSSCWKLEVEGIV